LGLFLLTVAGISLSGVMMPGPVFAATVARGWKSKFAGPFIAIGHAIVEVPIMLLIYFGFYSFFQNQSVKIFLGLVGGIVLIYMGRGIFNLKKNNTTMIKDINPSSTATVAGAITSLFNPYFILWWATVGAALIMKSVVFGILGFALFGIVHWLCDLVWYSVVSYGVHHSKRVWGEKIQLILYGVSSGMLFGFGIWFIISSFKWMV